MVATDKKVLKHPFFAKTPKNFGLGGCPQPKRDMTRFVRWPKCVQLQRQRAVLLSKLKVPHGLQVFKNTLNKNQVCIRDYCPFYTVHATRSTHAYPLLLEFQPSTNVEDSKNALATSSSWLPLSRVKEARRCRLMAAT